MEHVFLPQGSKPPLVEYRGKRDYVGLSFREYAVSSGYGYFLKRSVLPWKTYRERNQIQEDKVVSFLETWLFCSLLQEVFTFFCESWGATSLYSHDDFVCEYKGQEETIVDVDLAVPPTPDATELHLESMNQQEKCSTANSVSTDLIQYRFCTSKLIQLLNTCSIQLHGRTSNLETEYTQLIQCFTLVASTLRWVGSDLNPLFRAVVCSVAELIGVALSRALRNEHYFDLPTNDFPQFLLLGQSDWSKKMMITNGWCPKEVMRLKPQVFALQAMYFLMFMKRYPVTRHARCTEEDCVDRFILRKPMHRINACHCSLLSTTSNMAAQMQEIMGRDQFLLVELVEDVSNGMIMVRLVPYMQTDKYVAISHVWSDGLGNPVGNELPLCQIRHLYEVIRSLWSKQGYPPEQRILLWLDTLCCPFNDVPCKIYIISRMRKIYENSSYVLVLDFELQQIRFESKSQLEIVMRVLKSRWMTRLWTLQEGNMAKRLWIEFHDTVASIDEFKTVKNDDVPIECKWILIYAKNLFWTIRKELAVDAKMSEYEWPNLINATQERCVTKAADEPICIATLLKLDTGLVASTPESQRMQKLWELVLRSTAGIPSTVIFRPGLKLSEAGYRWAPSSLLSDSIPNAKVPDLSLRLQKTRGTLDPRGLRVQFGGFLISKVCEINPILQQRWSLDGPGLYTADALFVRLRDQGGSWSCIYTKSGARKTGTTIDDKGLGEAAVQTPFTELVNLSRDIRYAVILRSIASGPGLFVRVAEQAPQMLYVATLHNIAWGSNVGMDPEVYEIAYQTTQLLEQQFSLAGDLTPERRVPEDLDKVIADAAADAFSQHPDLEGLVRRVSDRPQSFFISHVRSMLAGCFHFAATSLPENQSWCVD